MSTLLILIFLITHHCLYHPWFLNSKCLDCLKDINNALCLATLDAIQQGTEHPTSADGVTENNKKLNSIRLEHLVNNIIMIPISSC